MKDEIELMADTLAKEQALKDITQSLRLLSPERYMLLNYASEKDYNALALAFLASKKEKIMQKVHSKLEANGYWTQSDIEAFSVKRGTAAV